MQNARIVLALGLVALVGALVPASALATTQTKTVPTQTRTKTVLTTTHAKTVLSTTHAKTIGTKKHTKTVPTNNPIVVECETHGYQLTGHYSIAALKAAYNSIPVSTREYTPCPQVIQNAIISDEQAGHIKPGHAKSSGSGFPVIVVIIIVIMILGAGGAFYSYRRSQTSGDNDGDLS